MVGSYGYGSGKQKSVATPPTDIRFGKGLALVHGHKWAEREESLSDVERGKNDGKKV